MKHKPKKRRKLLWQLYPSYMIIILFSLLAVSWYATAALKNFFMQQTAVDLKAQAIVFKEMFDALPDKRSEHVDLLCKKIGKRIDTRITVILANGVVVGDSEEEPAGMDNHLRRPEIHGARMGNIGKSVRYSATLEQRMMYMAFPVRNGVSTSFIVRTALPLAFIDHSLESIRYQIFIGGLFIAIFAAVVSLLVSHKISRPLEKMKEGAERFARGWLSHRLDIPKTEELASLAITLNDMASNLDDRIKTIIRHRNELEAVLGSMKEGIIALDRDEKIISINHSAAAMFNKDPWEMESRSIQEVIRNPELQKFVKKALSKGDMLNVDIIFYQKEDRILNVHSATLLDVKEDPIGILIVLNDVTRLRRLENMRKDFVANVSHEIKTPLTAIQGFVETLLSDKDTIPENAARFLTIIDKHVHRLAAIIEDLLNLSWIEQEGEKQAITVMSMPVTDVIKTAMQVVQATAAEKNIRFNFRCEKGFSADLDPHLMEQAIVNLLDNAIKYSHSDSTVDIEILKENNNALIRIRDHGIGIAKEHLPRLFERFYRVDKARSRKLGGTGLGLAIVKHIVRAHGGKISVQSELAGGSVFSIYFPVKQQRS